MQYWKPLVFTSAWLASAVQAQVTLDGTVGPAGALSGPNYQVTAELGQQVGGNLFHSFGQFSVNTGESATFSGPNSVSNIIGRVTGGQMSFIDGTIQSTIPGANLYLLNPAGMLFGENARLDVNGAFHVSTADYLSLSDGGRFDVRTPANSLLTVAPVTAFGFLSESPAPIMVNGGFLQVPAGQTLSLIGGDLSLNDATLYAPGGQINLAAVGSAGEVAVTDTDVTLRGFARLGEITVERTEAGRVVIDEVELGDIDASGPGGGAIFIRGGQFMAQGRSQTQANTTGDQDGRGISVEVDRLILTGGARIESNTSGRGRSGDINVTATEEVMIDGAYFDVDAERLSPSGLTTDALADLSQAGNITISTARLVLTGGGAITSVGRTDDSDSRAGNLDITATELITIDALNPDYVGNVDITGLSTAAPYYAGDITIKTARLSLTDGGAISSFTWGSSDGIVRGGDIDINATEWIIIDGPNSNILADNYGPLTSSGAGSGNAGNITLNTARLFLTAGGVITSTSYGVGRGGNLNITVSDSVIIEGYSDDPKTGYHFISGFNTAGYEESSDAGNITLTTRNLLIDDGGGIFAISLLASGGNITINADHIKLFNDAQITSSVSGSELTEGGNITINSINLLTLDGSEITAQAAEGKGGNIQINAEAFLHDASDVNDVLNASSQVSGNDGMVAINAPNAESISSLTVLPDRYLNAADQMGRRCGASDPESRSRFIVQGRGRLPPDPKQPANTSVTECSSVMPTMAKAAPTPPPAPPPTSVVQPAIAGTGFGDY
jgi:filamentous hemagglutinin family protein